jgi:hypothetical protein
VPAGFHFVPAGFHYPHSGGLHNKLMTETYAGSLRRTLRGLRVRDAAPALAGSIPRPSPYLLAPLARVYGCTATDLIDLADREQLPPAELLILDTYGVEIPNLRNENRLPQLPHPRAEPAPQQTLSALLAITVESQLGFPWKCPHSRGNPDPNVGGQVQAETPGQRSPTEDWRLTWERGTQSAVSWLRPASRRRRPGHLDGRAASRVLWF